MVEDMEAKMTKPKPIKDIVAGVVGKGKEWETVDALIEECKECLRSPVAGGGYFGYKFPALISLLEEYQKDHPACTDSLKCPNCGKTGEAAKLPHSCAAPFQPAAAESRFEDLMHCLEGLAKYHPKLESQRETILTLASKINSHLTTLTSRIEELGTANDDLEKDMDETFGAQKKEIESLQSRLDTAEAERIEGLEISKQDYLVLIKTHAALIKDTTGLQSRLDAAEGLLRDALPHIECKNADQSGLITAIGEFLEAEQKEGE
jgi:hypothetical protein